MVGIVQESIQMENLTENEAILYDRQIRLWGLEAQKRLRKTRLLVIGCQGLSGEAVKNIVLAGIESVVLCDSENATEADVKSNFLIPVDCVGKNRATSSINRTQVLNPTVKVSADTRPVNEIDEEYLKEFTVVLATNCNIADLIRINELCRKHNIKFYCGHVWGLLGYYFVDLKHHYYVQEIKKLPTKNRKRDHSGTIVKDKNVSINMDDEIRGKKTDNDSDIEMIVDDEDIEKPSTSKASIVVKDDEDEDLIMIDENQEQALKKQKETQTPEKNSDEEESQFVEKEERFPSLKEALEVDLTDPVYASLIRRKRLDPTLFAVLALLKFRSVYNRNPSEDLMEKEDFARLLKIREEVMKLYEMDVDYLPINYFRQICKEVSPVCAVVGGILAQEIILAVSGTEPPHKNFFLFNPIQFSGRIHSIGKVE